jgi:hypothetical protein
MSHHSIFVPSRDCTIAASRHFIRMCDSWGNRPADYDYHKLRVDLNDNPRSGNLEDPFDPPFE